MYTALLLDQESRDKLKQRFEQFFPEGWQVYCHHLTLNMGPITKGENPHNLLNTEMKIMATDIGMNAMAVAARCHTSGLVSVNKNPHVTLAVNAHGGGKPVMSNDIKIWCNVDPIVLCGKVVEIGT